VVVTVIVPDDLGRLLTGFPDIDEDEQAFPFLTVDENGFPHGALLSRSEVDVSSDNSAVLIAVGSVRTRANLERDGRAAVIAVDGTIAHYAKLRVVRSLVHDGILGCALEIFEHKRDTLGVPLSPIMFRTTAEIATLERWTVTARVLRRLDEA
jgi:hypothetical protein